jgi:hypothetical protein
MRVRGLMIVLMLLAVGRVGWAEDAVAPKVKEWETPVAQVLMAVQGTVTVVDAPERTFTVMQPPRHRQPPLTTVVGVNRDTKYVLNEAVLASMLQVGDRVRVEAQRPAPLGVAIWAEGKVTGLDPLIVEASKDVKVTVLPGAEVVLVRIRDMKFEDLEKGMEVQVVGYRATNPLVAKSIETFTVARGAATFLTPEKSAEPPKAEPEKAKPTPTP